MENNIEDIKRQFEAVIRYSQQIYDPKVDELFNKWLEAKRDFIEAMDGKLIYEYPETICFELNNTEKDKRLNEFIERVEDYYGEQNLADFLDSNREGFFNNSLITDWRISNGDILPKGMRLVKAFKYFIEEESILNKLQIEASMIIQGDKIEGTLCLSVHPLDFLSSSENTHNWRSCHALDGEYRNGNLSYMVDKSTIMVYLKSKEDVVLPNFPPEVLWNSKKWRMLLFFSDDWNILFAGRQYPFFSKTALEIVKNKLLPRTHIISDDRYYYIDWCQDKIGVVVDSVSDLHFSLEDRYIPVSGQLRGINDIIKDADNSTHFNDLLRSSCYDPYYTMKRRRNSYMIPASRSKIIIGGTIPCVCCGKNPATMTETMRCRDCELAEGNCNNDEFGYCSCCDAHIYLDDAYWVDGNPVCVNCYEAGEIGRCECCGEMYFKNDLRFNEETGGSICTWCASLERIGNY